MRILSVLGAMVPGLILTYGIWLVSTPDSDGGRQAMGRFVVGLVAFIVVVVIVPYAVTVSTQGWASVLSPEPAERSAGRKADVGDVQPEGVREPDAVIQLLA
jgi:hypothetical protein